MYNFGAELERARSVRSPHQSLELLAWFGICDFQVTTAVAFTVVELWWASRPLVNNKKHSYLYRSLHSGVMGLSKCQIGAIIFGVLAAASLGITLGVLSATTPSSGGGGGGGGGSGRSLPMVKPPVLAAAPATLRAGVSGQGRSGRLLRRVPTLLGRRLGGGGGGGGVSGFKELQLDPTDVKSRFFNPDGGPTNLFNILDGVDERTAGINARLGQFSGCMGNAPTPYSLTTWGSTQTFYAQCSEFWSDNSGFDQWALVTQGNETAFYMFVSGGDGFVAAKLTSPAGSSANLTLSVGAQVQVMIWASVGVINRNGTHGVMQVYADPSAAVFEISVAGSGMGYCGAQLKSNNATINVTGSADMGSVCQATDSVCAAADDLSNTSVTCSATANAFLLPALGRRAYGAGQFGASAYPGPSSNQVILLNTGPDDTFFGPSSPTV
jgi:hypothetical protein